MKKIALALALLVAAVWVAGCSAATATTIKYKYVVPAFAARAFAQGAGVPLSHCAFIKQHRVFGCQVSSRGDIILTRPKLYTFVAYAVVNHKVVWHKTVKVGSGLSA